MATRSVDSEEAVAGSSAIDGATVLTIPATRIFRGAITLSAAVTNSANAGSAISASPSVSVTGAGAIPSGTIIALELRLPANAVSGLTGTNANESVSISNVVIKAPPGGAVTVVLVTGGATVARATAVGVLL